MLQRSKTIRGSSGILAKTSLVEKSWRLRQHHRSIRYTVPVTNIHAIDGDTWGRTFLLKSAFSAISGSIVELQSIIILGLKGGIASFIFFRALTTSTVTRKPCYRKDDRAMRPILYGCPENFRESLATPTTTFLEIVNGLLLRSIVCTGMCVQNLKFCSDEPCECTGQS